MTTETELAWSAGFFDGEGTTSVLKAKRDKYSYIRMQVTQKNADTLERLQTALGGLGRIYKGKTRDIYSWNVYKQEDVLHCLTLLWPFLCRDKKEQAERVMSACNITKGGVCGS
jgi:hypothetical protein